MRKGRIILADGHHDGLPYALQELCRVLREEGFQPEIFCENYTDRGYWRALWIMLRFLPRYAQAEYVFLCDTFLPVSSCRKRPETTVVQIWHSCGLLKKMGYDTAEDAAGKGRFAVNPYRNFDFVVTSAQAVSAVFSSAMRLPPERFHALGCCKTDPYFTPGYGALCRQELEALLPEARGRRVLIWAPTFRGEAGSATLCGEEAIARLRRNLDADTLLIERPHEWLRRTSDKRLAHIPTERLIAAAEAVITDYSSLYYDALLLGKPVILFAPDMEQYRRRRGFYLPYQDLSGFHTDSAEGLVWAAAHLELWHTREAAARGRELVKRYAYACDGKTSRRILLETGLLKKRLSNDTEEKEHALLQR